MGSRFDSGDKGVRTTIVKFARLKLLGTAGDEMPSKDGILAAIATRIPLEFNPVNVEAANREQIQVEKHLRVCLSVQSGITGATTASASEPLIAEAAREAMLDMNVPAELAEALQRSGMDKGDRGEMAAMLLFIQAYDAARTACETTDGIQRSLPAIPLISLLDHLLASFHIMKNMPPTSLPRSKKSRSLTQSFKHSKVYFNHFARVYDSTVLNQKYLPGFVRRGAAILCVAGQAAVDLCIPFVYRDDQPPTEENVGLIYVQVKNNARYGAKPHRDLFTSMDPYSLGVFDKRHTSRPPIVRLVFALAAAESVAKVIPLAPTYPPTVSRFTAFDIWCAGASQKTFSVIKNQNEEDIYRLLLQLSQRINDAFAPKTRFPSEMSTILARRGMLPFASSNLAHWESFFNVRAAALPVQRQSPKPRSSLLSLPKQIATGDTNHVDDKEEDTARPPRIKVKPVTKASKSTQLKKVKKTLAAGNE